MSRQNLEMTHFLNAFQLLPLNRFVEFVTDIAWSKSIWVFVSTERILESLRHWVSKNLSPSSLGWYLQKLRLISHNRYLKILLKDSSFFLALDLIMWPLPVEPIHFQEGSPNAYDLRRRLEHDLRVLSMFWMSHQLDCIHAIMICWLPTSSAWPK